MKKTFLTGLVILLPLTITFVIIRFFLRIVTGPFEKLTYAFLSQIPLFSNGNNAYLMHAISSILILIIGIFSLALFGYIARFFAFRSLLHFSDRVLRKIPGVNHIYRACKDFTDVLFSPKSGSFTQVVLFPFPSKETVGIGLITSEFESNIEDTKKMYASILIPGTPNPMTGFLLILPKEVLTPLDIPVDEAVKYMMSCGAYLPEALIEKQITLR